MRNVDTKQKNAAHVLQSFCFIKPAKKSNHFSKVSFHKYNVKISWNFVQIVQIIVAKNFKTIYN